MPVMDGYTATRILREQKRFIELPILALTANAMAGDKEKVLAVGMNEHISKPINVNELFRVMAKWIVPSHPSDNAVTTEHVIDNVIPEMDGINTELGLERVQGNNKLYRKLLLKTAASQTGFVAEFDSAMTNKDWELATRLAHTLKGVAGSLGAEELQEASAALEAQSNEQLVSDEVMEAVITELSRFLNSVTAIEEKEVDATTAILDIEQLAAMLQTLAEQFSNYDAAAQDTFDAYPGLLAVSELKPQFKLLETALANYDFDAATTVIKDIALEYEINL